MRWLRRALLLAVILGLMVGGWRFASENRDPVTVHYLAGELVDVALWKVMVAAFGAGAVIVAMVLLATMAVNGMMRRRYRKEIGGLEAEIHQLRNLPLAPESQPPMPPSLAPESRSPGGSAPVGVLPTGGASGGNG
jgi:uncharacterized integral membrane protein